jgi:hypothetical protein
VAGVVLGVEFSAYTDGKLPNDVAIGVLVTICCVFVGERLAATFLPFVLTVCLIGKRPAQTQARPA